MAKTTLIESEVEVPRTWYNILPDLPRKLPPMINPATGEKIKPRDLEMLFPKSLVEQEFSGKRFIKIPEEVREIYATYRPTPLNRARRLEKYLKTPAKIYYKYEGVSATGSHKVNTALAQAYYNSREGVERLTTETGAGQWGSALAFASNIFGIDLTVFMVKVSYNQKPLRRVIMEIFGAKVVPSPSTLTEAGKKILEIDPDTSGSLGIAISEAIEFAVKNENTKYSLGSVLNHVLLHQTVIGEEALTQMRSIDEYPDVVIGCVGGGSNFAGLAYPFYREMIDKKLETKFIAIESTAAPSLTKGEFIYDFGDTARLTPLLKMYSLGHQFVPNPIHAGGLRYHGSAPTLSILKEEGYVEARAYNQVDVMEAATLFSRLEGIIPAPESAHAVKGAMEIAKEAKKKGEEITILFNLSGHGLLDLSAYDEFLKGRLQPYEMEPEKIKRFVEETKRAIKNMGINAD